jgi:hypothetical protein
LTDQESAKRAAHIGAGAAALGGSVVALIVTLNVTGATNNFLEMDAWNYVDASVFIVLAIFIYRMSRIAAVLALPVFVLERIDWIANPPAGTKSNVATSVIWALFYINALRGAFAWHRMQHSPSQS